MPSSLLARTRYSTGDVNTTKTNKIYEDEQNQYSLNETDETETKDEADDGHFARKHLANKKVSTDEEKHVKVSENKEKDEKSATEKRKLDKNVAETVSDTGSKD